MNEAGAQRGEFAQVIVDQPEQLVGGLRIALFDGRQDLRNWAHGRHDTARRGKQGAGSEERGARRRTWGFRTISLLPAYIFAVAFGGPILKLRCLSSSNCYR
jgi:hypothetical protein